MGARRLAALVLIVALATALRPALFATLDRWLWARAGVVSAAGSTYYVAPNGSNANAGTATAPWATPGYGSRQLRPGDTLIVLGGRYVLSLYDDDILVPPSGTASAWVTIRGEEGNRPILAGGDDLATAIDLSGTSYVRVENLEITHNSQASGQGGWFRDGMQIMSQPSSHIVLRDLYIHHIDEFGMNFQDVDDLQVLNCRVEYCGFGSLGGPTGEAGGWRHVRVSGSSLSYGGHYYQGGNGADRPYDRPDGLGVEAGPGPIEILDTVAEHNRGDGLDSKAADTTIRRCIVANNSCDGIKLWDGRSLVENTLVYGRGDGDAERTPWAAVVIHTEQADADFELLNVTVDDALGDNYLMHVQYDYPDVPIDLTVKNCIFRGSGPNSPLYVAGATRLSGLHNLFHLPQTEFVMEHGDHTYTSSNLAGLGTGNLYGDPRFVAPAWGTQGDYHLQSGSPAVNAGSADGAPADDLERRSRDARPDIGAYEWTGGTSSATATPTRTRTQVAPGTIRPRLYLPVVLKAYPRPAPTRTATPTLRPSATATLTRAAATPTATTTAPTGNLNPNPPGSTVKLVFIHHSTGEGWLNDEQGRLGVTLRDNNYFVSDTNYGWGPDGVGDLTDIGHWWTWFRGPNRDSYMSALFDESGQWAEYSRLATDPGGPNHIVMFKSCFPNSQLAGSPADPPTTGSNLLRGQDSGSEFMTVANAKGIYNDLLAYFATRQDKLFIAITAPPLVANSTDAGASANARAFNNWLVNDWLETYPHRNVAVFDFFNVLTSNGGNTLTNDLGRQSGNHHRWWQGAVQHIQTVASNYAAYGSDPWDSHPTAAGGQKASAEFVPLLNVAYHCWKGDGGCPERMGR